MLMAAPEALVELLFWKRQCVMVSDALGQPVHSSCKIAR
jgi:hypothetical protein